MCFGRDFSQSRFSGTHTVALLSAAVPIFCLCGGSAFAGTITIMDRFDKVGDELIRDAGRFGVRGYHQHIYPERMPMKVFHDRLEQLVAHDYNLVVFGMGSPASAGISMHADDTIIPNGCSTEEMRRLVAHAVELGIEPVFEMKFIGKQLPLLGEVIDRHPGLVIDPENRSTVLNANFSMPDGTGAYDATALRLVDYLLSLYPEESPARYFVPVHGV